MCHKIEADKEFDGLISEKHLDLQVFPYLPDGANRESGYVIMPSQQPVRCAGYLEWFTIGFVFAVTTAIMWGLYLITGNEAMYNP